MTTTVTKSIGTGKDYATLQAFATWLATQDLVATDQMVIGEVYESLTVSATFDVYPLTYSANNYCLLRPAAGLGVNDLENTGPLTYGTSGIEITRPTGSGATRFSHGVVVEGFRIKMTGAGTTSPILLARKANTSSYPNGVKDATMRKCRILNQLTAASVVGIDCYNNSSTASVQDCLVINEGGSNYAMKNNTDFQRCTFVGRGSALGLPIIQVTNPSIATCRDNVFVGGGATPINNTTTSWFGVSSNNFTDTAMTGTSTGFTVAANPLQSATDYRPATGSPLIAGASSYSNNTNDLRGQFRGTVPDVGATMLTAAALPNLADATITAIVVKGQHVHVEGTYTNSYTSVTAALNAAATPNGAVSTTTTVVANNGTFTADFKNVTPGNYDAPVITFTNQSGNGGCTGGTPVTVAVPAVPTIKITTQSKNGQTVVLSGTTTGYPVSGTASLPASATPNGAVTQNANISFNDNDQSFSVTFNSVPYGSYAAPTVNDTNFSGTGNDAGSAFTLYAPGTQPPGLPAVDLPAFVAPDFLSASATVALNAEITNITVENTSSVDQTNMPFTYGQPFKAGELSPHDFLVGKVAGSADIQLQMNVKATHPDGSVRHAIITGIVPSLPVSSNVLISIVRTNTTTTSNVAVSAASIVTDGFSASTSITIGGVNYVADCTASMNAGTNLYKTWITGNLCTEYVYNIPLKNTSDNTLHPTLTVQFCVRHYPTVNKTRVDITVEHTKAYASTSDITYDVSHTVSGNVKYTQTGLVHFPCARWTRSYDRTGGVMVSHVKHNVAYLIGTKQVPNYDQTIVMDEATLQGWADQLISSSDFMPMGRGRFVADMGTTGGRPDIGLCPDSYAATILSQDRRAFNMMIASARAGGSWAGHRRDDSTGPAAGRPIDIIHFPYATILGTQSDSKNPATGQYEKFPALTTTSQLREEVSHQPAFAYVPYLLTGDFAILEELQFWTNYNHYSYNPGYRNYSDGLLYSNQMRGQAWSMRTVSECAAITPDSSPDKSTFKYWLDKNLTYYNNRFTDGSDNVLGVNTAGVAFAYNMNGQTSNGIAPWQDDFFTSAIGHSAELGNTEAGRLLKWKAKFQVSRMLGPGFCWINGAIYELQIRDTGSSAIYTDIGTAFQKSVSANLFNAYTTYGCNSQQYVDVLNAERALPSNPYIIGQMTGYSQNNDGFPSNMQPALAMAADSGYTDADLAWMQFDGRTVKPTNYNVGPQFAIVPRSVASSGGGGTVTVPGAPTNVLATAGNGKATVSFTAPADNGGAAITSYLVTASTGQTASGVSSPINITVPNGVAVNFTVHAINSSGPGAESAPSNTVTPSATGPSVPGAPTGATAAVNGDNTVSVSFNPPTSDGGSAITGYQVNSSAGGVFNGASSPIICTIPFDTNVSFTVKAINAAGPGPASAPSNSVSIASVATVTTVDVIPATAVVNGGNSLTLQAVVEGTNSPAQDVTWICDNGTITSAGVYTAPAAGIVDLTVTITAKSVADPTKSGTAIITVPQQVLQQPLGTSVRHYDGNITNKFGVAIEGAKVTVFNSDTGLLAELWEDKEKSKKKFNPVITDDEGFFEFFVEAQQCSYSVKGYGIEPYTRNDIFDIISNVDLTAVQQAIGELQKSKASVTLVNALDASKASVNDLNAVSAAVVALQTTVNALPVPAVVDAHKYVTGGAGTEASPWTGWDTGIMWSANTQYDFHDGVYAYETSPNFAKNFLKIKGRKNTMFKHLGTGYAFLCDAGGDPSQVAVGVEVENVLLVSNGGALGGVYQRGCTQSKFDFKFRDIPGICFSDISGVLNVYNLVHSPVGMVETVRPNQTLFTDKRAGSPECSGNKYRVIAENCNGFGIDIVSAINCEFSGVAQLNGYGLYVSQPAKHNNFNGMEITHNTYYDIAVDGEFNTFNNVRSDSFATFGGKNNTIVGGLYDALDDKGMNNNFGPLVYSINGGRFNIGGQNESKRRVYNATTAAFDADDLSAINDQIAVLTARLDAIAP